MDMTMKEKDNLNKTGNNAQLENSREQEIDGKFCKELRERLEISADEFAMLLGVTSQTLRRWESQKGEPSYYQKNLLWNITKAYEKNPNVGKKIKNGLIKGSIAGGLLGFLSELTDIF